MAPALAPALALALALAWREPCTASHPLRVRSIGVVAGVNNVSPRYRSLSTVRPWTHRIPISQNIPAPSAQNEGMCPHSWLLTQAC